MKSPEESESEIRSERGEVVIPVHQYVQGSSLAQKELNSGIRRLLVLGVRRFALDVGQVTRMDSESIGVLVQVFTIINDSAGEYRIINLPPRVKDIFNITGLF
jgi:anti-anti-sigma factor